MKAKLDIQWFIEQHSDWEKILSEKPYCLNISREKWNGMNLVMLKYNQIDSNFNEKIVRQCRGIILNEDTLEVVSYPFEKFGNVNEGSWVEPISWDQHPYVLDKIDGSLIKIVKVNNKLLISTNGTIDAFKAPIADQIGCTAKNFGELVIEALKNAIKQTGSDRMMSLYPSENAEISWLRDRLQSDYTYMFELTSPWNRVVVDHHETKLWFIGCRDNRTCQELFIKDHILSKTFDTPQLHEFDSFEACVETAKNLPWNEEGYVITSRDFKRNKAKSLGYLSCHHLRNNGVMSYERAIELVRLNEVDEVLSYFPEFKDALLDVKEKYNDLISSLETSWDGFMTLVTPLAPRKEAAIWIQKNFRVPGCGFALLDNKVASVREWIGKNPPKNLVKALGYKE